MIPKIRVPAAFTSPASLFLIGGLIWVYSIEFESEEELERKMKQEFPQAFREKQEQRGRMREHFRRVTEEDPREEERIQRVMQGGSHNTKRLHATQEEIDSFGDIPPTVEERALAKIQFIPNSTNKTSTKSVSATESLTRTDSVVDKVMEEADKNVVQQEEPPTVAGDGSSTEKTRKSWWRIF